MRALACLSLLLQTHSMPAQPGLEEALSQGAAMEGGVFWFSMFLSIGISVLFGWWGKLKAEEHGVNPWVGFVAGFLLLYIGVRIVPILRKDRIFNKPAVGAPLPRRGSAPLPPGFAPPTEDSNQQVSPSPSPSSPPDNCPACGAPRTAGRRNCMTCGAQLPKAGAN